MNNKDVSPEEKLIETHASDLQNLMKFISGDPIGPRQDRIPDPGIRFIMTVTGYAKFPASDFIGYTQNEKLTNGMVIQLTGTPTPSTPRKFTTAFLIFAGATSEMRKPQVVDRGARYELYIYYPLGYLDTVERMLTASVDCYAWIGNFGSPDLKMTNIHADLHAVYVKPRPGVA